MSLFELTREIEIRENELSKLKNSLKEISQKVNLQKLMEAKINLKTELIIHLL